MIENYPVDERVDALRRVVQGALEAACQGDWMPWSKQIPVGAIPSIAEYLAECTRRNITIWGDDA